MGVFVHFQTNPMWHEEVLSGTQIELGFSETPILLSASTVGKNKEIKKTPHWENEGSILQKHQKARSSRTMTAKVPMKSSSCPGNPKHWALGKEFFIDDQWPFYLLRGIRERLMFILLCRGECALDNFFPLLLWSWSQSNHLCVWNLYIGWDLSEPGYSSTIPHHGVLYVFKCPLLTFIFAAFCHFFFWLCMPMFQTEWVVSMTHKAETKYWDSNTTNGAFLHSSTNGFVE